MSAPPITRRSHLLVSLASEFVIPMLTGSPLVSLALSAAWLSGLPGVPMKNIFQVVAFSVIALTTLVATAQQNFQKKYYPFDNLFPAVQVDLNNDGIPDFIAETRNLQIQELLSTGSGNYVSKILSVSGSAGGYPIASGDFNKDGKADVIFWPTGIAYGNGSGGFSSFKSMVWPNTSGYDTQAVVADFNSDGRADLAVAYSDNSNFQVLLILNNGSGFASPKVIYSQAVLSGSTAGFEYTTPLDLVMSDFDADGHADLFLRTTESDPNNPANAITILTALYGNGAGSFTASKIATANDLYRLAAADLNGDGRSDVVASGFSFDGNPAYPMRIYYGHANRTFTEANQAATNDRALPPMLADFNGDRRKDIIYPELTSSAQDNIGISELLRTSTGTYVQQGFFPNDTYNGEAGIIPFSQSFVGDYNHDGRPDVALISSGNQVEHPNSLVIMLNEGVPPDSSCMTPSGIGIAVCSPVSGAIVSSPVSFAFSANYFYPLRKTEVWIDGAKKSEQYEVFATEGFHRVNLSLAAGTHSVALFAVANDGKMLLHKSYSITVK